MGLQIQARASTSSYACSSSTQELSHAHQNKVSSQTHKIKTASEAEHLLDIRKRPRLTRQASSHQLGRGGEIEDLSLKSAALWDCVGKKPNRLGGYIYEYKLKEQFDNITAKSRDEKIKRWEASVDTQNRIYPALEKRGIRVLEWDPVIASDKKRWVEYIIEDEVHNIYATHLKTIDQLPEYYHDHDILWEHINRRARTEKSLAKAEKKAVPTPEVPILRRLGFECRVKEDGVYLYVPGKEALIVNWEALMEEYPHLTPLDIVSGSGIAGDIPFVEAHMAHDRFYAIGPESLHDTLAHIVPMLILKLNSGINRNPTFEKRSFRIFRIIAKGYRTIMIVRRVLNENDKRFVSVVRASCISAQIEKIEASLGALTDVLSNNSSYRSPIEKFVPQLTKFEDFWVREDWQEYWEKRFGLENFDSFLLKEAWVKMLITEMLVDDVYPPNSRRKFLPLRHREL